ncbi:MAG TPA: Fic family protein [Longimicrobium sp.]|nr:Fic family protein [Longimicrobium sp.]
MAILAARPEGLRSKELEEAYAQLHPALPSRTIRRRLAALAAQGRAEAFGLTFDRRYRATAGDFSGAGPKHSPAHAPPAAQGTAPDYPIPLSEEGENVRAMVHRPIAEREPVAYNPEFLERYEPGATWYLPAELRAALHEKGRTPAEDRPAGTYARDIFESLLVDLSWASSRLEGNRYSRIQTEELLRFGQDAPGTNDRERQMILNHKAAIEMLVEDVEHVRFDRRTILGLHGLLAENLVGGRHNEGRLRTTLVKITDSPFIPLGIPQKVEDHFDLLLRNAEAIPDPFEQAFFVMVHLPYLQPFYDVNKRPSRLAANIPLIKANLSPLSFIDVPESAYVEGTLGVYELNRVELLRDVFAWTYERSCARYAAVIASVGKPEPIRLAYREELRALVNEMVVAGAFPDRDELREWAWRNGVKPEDTQGFVDNARADLLNLHAGILSRYRLRNSQFEAWEEKVEEQRAHAASQDAATGS